jgi:hypothetical protein
MMARSRSDATHVTCYSNHDFRSQLLVGYHQRGRHGRTIALSGKRDLPPEGAEWYILHDTRHGGVGAGRIADRHGNEYELDAVFRSGGISPGHWYIYRQVARRPGFRDGDAPGRPSP